MAKTLQIVESAYRATLEEQDDTIIWLTHAMKGAGAELDVLLRGNAVNYAVASQEPAQLQFGAKKQQNAPNIARDVRSLIDKGITVLAVEEDLRERGLTGEALVDGLKRIPRADLPKLLDEYPRVWHW